MNENSFEWAVRFRPELKPSVARARAKFITEAVSTIEGGRKDWQSLAWLLERRYRDLFGRQAEVQVNNAVVVGFTEAEMKIVHDTARKFLTEKAEPGDEV